jgi:SPP1 family holin
MHTPKLSLGTIARFLFLAITYLNQFFVWAGLPVIPIENPTTQNLLAWILTLVASIAAYWFDNDVTIKARVRNLLGKRAQALDQNK